MSKIELLALQPIIILSLSTLVLMLQTSIKRHSGVARMIALLGLGLALLSCYSVSELLSQQNSSAAAMQITALIIVDQWGLFFTALLLFTAMVTLVLSRQEKEEDDRGDEYYLLLLLASLGAIILSQANHVASLLLGMELMGIALYGLIAFSEKSALGLEAAIKYLVLSASASAMLLFGFALLYAASGELSFAGIGAKAAAAYQQNPVLVLAAIALLLSGFAFKLSLVPFHMWTADVYQGAPITITAFLATVAKAAMLVVLCRLFIDAQLQHYPSFINALSLLAIASMLAGNILALRQLNVKRLLAYSSIAHYGYLLIVLIAASHNQALITEASSFYLCAYIFSSLAAFTALANLDIDDGAEDQFALLKGLFWNQPWQALLLTTALLSLAGIPLTAGFIAKFYIINSAVAGSHWLLVGSLVIASATAIFYYLRLIFAMSKTADTEPSSAAVVSHSQNLLAFLLLLLVLWLGIWPQPLISYLGSL